MYRSVIIAALLFLFSHTSLSQTWNDEQKEVWANHEKIWNSAVTGDITTFTGYFDDSYWGWTSQNAVPSSKNDFVRSVAYWFSKAEVKLYSITPLKIWVSGNFAYVHYYYSMVTETPDGMPREERGRWTDILMKKGGKWVIVGDHGGAMDD